MGTRDDHLLDIVVGRVVLLGFDLDAFFVVFDRGRVVLFLRDRVPATEDERTGAAGQNELSYGHFLLP